MAGLVCTTALHFVSPTLGRAAIYEVGPDQTYTKLGSVRWTSLRPGNTVNIHSQRAVRRGHRHASHRERAAHWPTILPARPATVGATEGRLSTRRGRMRSTRRGCSCPCIVGRLAGERPDSRRDVLEICTTAFVGGAVGQHLRVGFDAPALAGVAIQRRPPVLVLGESPVEDLAPVAQDA